MDGLILDFTLRQTIFWKIRFLLYVIKGERTWREDLRGRARDHTLGNPLLPPAQQSDPPTNLTTHEAIMLQYLPIRDDFEVSL